MCIYIYSCLSKIKNQGPGLGSLSNAKSNGSTHVLLGKWRKENLYMFLLRKGNFIMINEFRYGPTWKIWPSPLSLSLCSTFNDRTLFTYKNLFGLFSKKAEICWTWKINEPYILRSSTKSCWGYTIITLFSLILHRFIYKTISGCMI